MSDFSIVAEFEKQVAEFFGAPYGVAVDSCTHGLELCLRHTGAKEIVSPTQTYLSVPMLAKKLDIELKWYGAPWVSCYKITDTGWKDIVDAATFWKKDGFKNKPDNIGFLCLSFQFQKHLSLGRGGMILCENETDWLALKKMSYDGRLPGIPWREQDIETLGFHYYMTPETAKQGIDKLQEAIATTPRIWTHEDYPDLTKMKVFNNG